MSRLLDIRWKVMLMLVAFTVNFCVICHCAAAAVPVRGWHCHACCGGSGSDSGAREKKGKEGHGCQGMQAVKFNLLEKQVSSPISSGEQPVMLISFNYSVLVPDRLVADGSNVTADQWVYRHSPPDLQVLYQRFLI